MYKNLQNEYKKIEKEKISVLMSVPMSSKSKKLKV